MRWISQNTTGKAMTTPTIVKSPGSESVSLTEALKVVAVLVGTVKRLSACAAEISPNITLETAAAATAIFARIVQLSWFIKATFRLSLSFAAIVDRVNRLCVSLSGPA